MVSVDIASLSPGIHHVEFDPSAEAANVDPNTFDDIHVEAELQYHRNRILVRLQAAATATLTCDRTLEPYEEAVEGEYNLLYGPAKMVGQEGDEFEEVRPLDPQDVELDLTDVVRDTLLLALPQRRVAPGAPDEPIERQFGASDEDEEEATGANPVDPRWSKLQKLREGDADE